MSLPPRTWFKEFAWRSACVFFLLYGATISFDYYLLPNVNNWLGSPFHEAANFTGNLFFGVSLTGEQEFYSDSLLNYVHVFNCMLMAIIVGTIWTWRSKQQFTATKFQPWFLVALRYFVALNMFVYGFSKLYKWQFMYPEPNLLYQTVGNTPRDLLYWTSMGTSYTYSVFMGIMEIVPGILLLFRRTTLAGAILSVLVLMNVVAVNLGFDITVKIHSITLLLMSLVLIVPARKRVFAFFSGKATEEWKYPAPSLPTKRKWILPALKIAAVLLLFAESNYPYFETQNFNDDSAERPPMHGAYEVIETDYNPYGFEGPVYIDDDQPLAPGESPVTLEYIFLLRRGYIVFQYSDGSVTDYTMYIDAEKKLISYVRNNGRMIIREEITYASINDSTFVFEACPYERYDSSEYCYNPIQWTVKKLDMTKLPLLQEEFGWVDDPR